MNIISNNCCGGYFYNFINERQLNPFRFCWFDAENCLNILKNYETINFNNIELTKDSKWQFYLKIDNQINLRMWHHVFDPDYKEPTKVGENLRYCKIWETIVKQYTIRLKLMIEKPMFIIDCGGFNGWNNNKIEKFLKEEFNYPIVLIVHDKKFKAIIHKNIKIIYTPELAPKKIIDILGNDIKNYFLSCL